MGVICPRCMGKAALWDPFGGLWACAITGLSCSLFAKAGDGLAFGFRAGV